MPRQFLVTAALPYSNGRLHVGHIAGAYLPADIFVRYLRAIGDDVLFICGSDDNGAAIELMALKEGRQPAEIVEKYHASQRASFDGLGISFDVYGGTHHPHYVEKHNEISQDFFRTIYEKGFFSKRTESQWFDTVKQQFLPDRYVRGTCYICKAADQNGDQCEACGNSLDPLQLIDPKSVLSGTTPEARSTTHWYLRLDAFEAPLKEWLEGKKDWRPTVKNFALSRVNEGLPERAMTRDLSWGVPVPDIDPEAAGKVLYVWFDAPIGYVSFTAQLLADRGEPADAFHRYWKNPDCKIFHFIGEDNTVFHALTWPAMMLAEGSYQLPHAVVANSFLNIQFPGNEEEVKISKSKGTALWIEDYLNMYDPDPLRYYLTAIAPETARTAYKPDEFLVRNDSELVAALGNLVNRAVTFAHKYFDGKVPAVGQRDEVDHRHLAERQEFVTKVTNELESQRFKSALAEVMNLARAGNLYLDQKKPWNQRKTDLAACGQTINVCLQTVRTLTTLMAPFLPFAAEKSARMLGISLEAATIWAGATEELPAGQTLGAAEILFRKLADVAARDT